MIAKHKDKIIILALGLVYFMCARLSLNLAFDKSNASPIWPPSGLAFAAVIIFGRRALLSIFLGALAANFIEFQGNHQFSASIVLCSLLIGLGNTLEAFLGEKFYRSFSNGNGPLDSYQAYFRALMVTFAACLVGAFIGTFSLIITGIVPIEIFRTVLVTWWIGDYVGILIISPLILAFAYKRLHGLEKENVLEFAIHLVILIAISAVIFSSIGSNTVMAQMSFIILPFLLWMVYRFNVFLIAIAVTFVSFIAVFGTVSGFGPFVRNELNDSLLLLQAFLGVISVTFVVLSITLNDKAENKEFSFDGFYSKFSLWLASISFIICLGVSLFVIYSIEQKNERKIAMRIEYEISQYNQFFKSEFANIENGLVRMAQRKSFNLEMSKDVWVNDAKNYFEDFQIFRSVEYVDSSFTVKWLYPEKGNENKLNFNLNVERKRKEALTQALEEARFKVSKPVDLFEGGRGIVFCAPIFKELENKGFVLGVLELDKLLRSLVSEIENNYFVEIEIDGVLEYQSSNFLDNYFGQSSLGDFSSLVWNLKLVPRPSFLELLGKESNVFSIVLAFLVSVLFSLTVYLVFNARHKARSLFELNDNLQMKNIELNREKEVSQQAIVAKSQFLANMSHEIRTPMNGVLGALQLAMDGDDKEIRNYLKVIDISARNLMDIINDILDYSKIEAGKLNLEIIAFDMKKLVQESLLVVEGKAKSHNNSLIANYKVDNKNNFKGDPTRIRQILLNLLSNAVKFTEQGTVTVNVSLNHAQQLCIEVEDTGVGIPANKLEHIFEQFEQADTSTTRQYGGTGLGLSITRQLVELMDGKISVESEVDKGTSFKVLLPLEQTEIRLVEKSAELERRYGKRVLVCEDNEINREVIKATLERLGIDVEVVTNGLEAVQTIEDSLEKFDLIMMDLHMPQMDGFKSTSEILKKAPDMPVIALTANTAQRDRQLCLDLGMKGYLTKPIQKDTLVDELDKWFESAS